MKSFFILLLMWLSKTSSLTTQVLQKTKEPLRLNNGVYSDPKPNIFSPRMDYEEWTPLGRGDPLKNDPTYDYVPPVLERVHYWMDPSKRTPDPPLTNSGVLVLGSRTESTFALRPTTARYQPFQSKESQADSRIDTSSLLDPFFKLMDVSQFKLNFNSNANNHYKSAPSRQVQRPHHPGTKQKPQQPQALQRPPYTMLMPPPPPSHQVTNFITSQATTVPSQQATVAVSSQQTTVSLPASSNMPFTTKNATTINPTVLANTENMFKPVAISMPETVRPIENEKQIEVQATQKQPQKKTTSERTTTDVVLPIVTLFDTVETESKEDMKMIQTIIKNSHLQQPTTPKYKVWKNPPSADGSTRSKEKDALPPHTKNRPLWITENLRATTALPMTTTKIHTLTTDPMFKHYNQPVEPIKGPFYLIIQGHSKVKTYGASKNPINRLITSNEIKNDDEIDEKKNSVTFERKTRKLINKGGKRERQESNRIQEGKKDERVLDFISDENVESLEDAFPKSKGGSSKKRYLGSNHRRKRSPGKHTKRRLLNAEEEREGKKSIEDSSEKSENFDLESLIAVGDDYDPEDVANILLKEDGSQGSGLGNFALSVFSRTDESSQDV